MGKRSQQHMTGLSLEQRVNKAIKRKEEERRKRCEETAKQLALILGITARKRKKNMVCKEMR